MTDFNIRKPLYEAIEKERNSKVLVIVNGDRPGWETQLSRDFVDIVVDHLDDFPATETISLILHTNGGDTLAAWRLVNLIRLFCKHLEVLIPLKAFSAGTLISLGADKIVMTKQASIGSIDPSITTPLNPIVPGAPLNARVAVSVEAIKGYLEIARQELAIKDDASMASIFTGLSNQIHPIVLGQVFRARSQIQFIARKLLKHQVTDPDRSEAIIAFLCSESGSHDYTVDRREGRELGLNIETPTDNLYQNLWSIHRSFQSELQIREPYDPQSLIGAGSITQYEFKRCLIESIAGGCNAFISKGNLTKQTIQTPVGPQEQIADQRQFEGWRKIV